MADPTLKIIATPTKEMEGIPNWHDVSASTSFPPVFMIPYQYAALVRDVDAAKTDDLQFLHSLQDDRQPYYHNGCSLSSIQVALNAIRSLAQGQDDGLSGNPPIVGRIYEVILVFRKLSTDEVKNSEDDTLSKQAVSALLDAGFTTQDIERFVRLHAKALDDEFLKEPDDTISEAPVPAVAPAPSEAPKKKSKPSKPKDPKPVQEDPTNGFSEEQDVKLLLEWGNDMVSNYKSGTMATIKAKAEFLNKFFGTIDRNETADFLVKLKSPISRQEALSWRLNTLFTFSTSWSAVIDEFTNSFQLTEDEQVKISLMKNKTVVQLMHVIYTLHTHKIQN